MADYLPSNDAEYVIWSGNFASVAVTNAAALNFTAAQTSLLTAQADVFSGAVTDANTAKNAAKAANETKQLRKKELTETVRMLAQLVQANPNISDSLREQLGLPGPR